LVVGSKLCEARQQRKGIEEQMLWSFSSNSCVVRNPHRYELASIPALEKHFDAICCLDDDDGSTGQQIYCRDGMSMATSQMQWLCNNEIQPFEFLVRSISLLVKLVHLFVWFSCFFSY
jgi:hypothetical protein